MVIFLLLVTGLIAGLWRGACIENRKLRLALEELDDLHSQLHCSDWVTIEMSETIREALEK